MAKAIEYVIEMGRKEAAVFLENMMHPKKDPERDAIMERARRLNIEIR